MNNALITELVYLLFGIASMVLAVIDYKKVYRKLRLVDPITQVTTTIMFIGGLFLVISAIGNILKL